MCYFFQEGIANVLKNRPISQTLPPSGHTAVASMTGGTFFQSWIQRSKARSRSSRRHRKVRMLNLSNINFVSSQSNVQTNLKGLSTSLVKNSCNFVILSEMTMELHSEALCSHTMCYKTIWIHNYSHSFVSLKLRPTIKDSLK